MFLSAAKITKNMLEKSFPKLFGQGIAKIVVVKGKYNFIVAHTKHDVLNIRSILTNNVQESIMTTMTILISPRRMVGLSCSPLMACGLRARAAPA